MPKSCAVLTYAHADHHRDVGDGHGVDGGRDVDRVYLQDPRWH